MAWSKLGVVNNSLRLTLSLLLIGSSFGFNPAPVAAQTPKGRLSKVKTNQFPVSANEPGRAGRVYQPTSRAIEVAPPMNVARLAAQEALNPSEFTTPTEIKAFNAPKGEPPPHSHVPVMLSENETATPGAVTAPTPSTTGISPGPTKTFKGQFLSSTSIPPDTHGAVGSTYVVSSSNDFIRIQDRNGVELQRFTINSFWSTATIKGLAVASAFDTKVFYDRFNDRYILISSLNGANSHSGMGLAVTQTGDPTGTWNRFTAISDPASTGDPGTPGTPGSGHAIDYPSVGFNKNWIVVDENTFNYTCTQSGTPPSTTCGFTNYFGQQVFIFDKQAAYANTLSSVSETDGPTSSCLGDTTDNTNLGCGFTLAPSINEENTTDVMYMAEDWDSTNGQLRVSKITGTPSTPVLTIGTQFPQSPFSWRFNALRIGTLVGTGSNCGGTCSGGYMPQKQQSAYLPSSQRIMANDSRIQNVVYRNGSLWTTHTVMLASTPTPAGTAIGGSGNPIFDNHSAVQWWQVDPTIETGLPTPPTQRGRIEDSTADNCHDGNGATRATAPCNGTTSAQFGTFFAYPNISVNVNNDVLIGFSQFAPLNYPSSAYAIRLSGDTPNMMRDPVVFHSGQANYNIGGGSGTARQNRWGDYSEAQTDPVDDTTFWTVQEYSGIVRDFGIGLAGNWETWWGQVNTATAAPSTSGSLIIDEFRLRGPQGVNDEFVELYNPGASPVYVSTTDNSDGWALVYSSNGTTVTPIAVIPNGTVIAPQGHYLIARDPDGANGPTVTYSLTNYTTNGVRPAESDTGYAVDNADNGGLAIFKTATAANMNSSTRMDSVGFSSIAAGLFKEGNGIPAISASTPAGQMTFYRTLTSGFPQDTNVNENDFVFADPALETLGQTPFLGAAGPKNLDSPIQRNATVKASLIDPGCTGTAINPAQPTACLHERSTTPVTNGALGTLSIRRKFTNNTGAAITRLRFRVVDITGPTNQPAGNADVRLLTSPTLTNVPLNGGGTTTIQGLTLEEPPTQPNGGGLNSTVSAGVITLNAPLANGASINVQFLLGVQQGGAYRLFINIEALP